MSDAVRVVLADDHAPTRAGVRIALEGAGVTVCAEAASAAGAIDATLTEKPDACLLDVHMPGSGIHAAEMIKGRLPDVLVLMLTVSSEDDDLFDALRAGASGYLLKDMDPAELPSALRGALVGEAALPGRLTSRIVAELNRRGGHRSLVLPDRPGVELTPREWDVLDLLRAGLATREIAGRLFVSPVTVRRHRSDIFRKLGVSSLEEALELVPQSAR